MQMYMWHIYIYISYIYDSQIEHHNSCFNLFMLHSNPFDNQGSEINKNDIFLRFDILSFTKTFFLQTYLYIYSPSCKSRGRTANQIPNIVKIGTSK